MEDGFDIITGADGFIGKELSEELSKSNPILLSRTKKYYKNASYVQYDMETGLNSLINSDIKINNVIHLAHDFSNKYLDNKNINIKGIEDLINFCKIKKSKLIYISSFMAISAKTIYGKTKLECEELVNEYSKSIIIRPPVVVDNKGGVFGRLNQIFKYSPLFPIPGNGDYPMYYVKVKNLVRFINKSRSIQNKELIHCYDSGPVNFKDLLNIENKVIIKLPIKLLRIILVIPKIFGIKLKSLSNDGLSTLLAMPLINFEHKKYTDY
ncbi:sugar nucleotide-binding protein [bacterium]|nr:sugar nucleotide-binding protein [bacterium]